MRDSLTSLNVSSSNQNKAVFFLPIRIKLNVCQPMRGSLTSRNLSSSNQNKAMFFPPIRIKLKVSQPMRGSLTYIRKNYSITYDFISENNHVLKSNTLHCFLYGVTISTRNKHTDSNRYKNAFSICIMYITIADNKWQGGKKLFVFFFFFSCDLESAWKMGSDSFYRK